MAENAAEIIGSLALEGLLFEAAATPKPGLVDRLNCGAHSDMDFFTFQSSAAALGSWFVRFASAGREGQSQPLPELFPTLRRLGAEAEQAMFTATGGVNTHKGAVFSMAVLCGCAGWLWGQGDVTVETVCRAAGELCRGLCRRDFAALAERPPRTKGERLYLDHGITGIRGEAESGYETVRQLSAPRYRAVLARGLSRNDALVQTLLELIARTADTNILARGGPEAAEYARRRARQVLALGGMETAEGREAALEMDRDFIQRWISPGGSADLLAVTHFLVSLEERFVSSKERNTSLTE